MKKIFSLLLAFVLLLSVTACNSSSGQANANQGSENQASANQESVKTEPAENQPSSQMPADTSENSSLEKAETDEPEGKTLIAYFSATGSTEAIAQHLGHILEADLYEIVPEEPYSSVDLDYNTDCRANQEQNDPSARPGIAGSVEDLSSYDVVFLGYPIWWGQAPKIISTFLESYDFNGKTIVPFCTSGSSDIGSSATNLEALADGAKWLEGNRFSGSASESDVQTWAAGLDLDI